MHFVYFREMMRSFRQHGSVAVTAILSLAAALTLSAMFLLLSWNAHVAIDQLGDRREMVVYLNDDVTPAERDVLIGRVHDLYGNVTYVTKDQAWKEFVSQVGDASLLEAVGDNPLPASLRIKLKPELLTAESMELTARQISGFPEVEDVRYGAEWVRRLDQVARSLLIVTISVLVLAGLAVMMIVYNTLRLTVLTRRQQVEVMARLGATGRFIATPFVMEALSEALIAALLALGVLWAAQLTLAAQGVGDFAFLPPVGVLAFLVGVLLLTFFASLLALTRVFRAVGS
ncbi:MAG: cell division protein FtsX [Candidatus Eisenbacteria bacterium]